MQPRDKIGKSSWMIQEAIKDSVDTSVVAAVRSGQFKLDPPQLALLLTLLRSSIEAGYGKAFNVFMREVDTAIAGSVKKTKK